MTEAWRELGTRDALVRIIRALGARITGVGGPPGGGKSTLAHQVSDELGDAFVISLDDYYLSKDERRARGLPWRGPPGSHDLAALAETLDRIRGGRAPVTVERFSAEVDDRIEPVTLSSVPAHVLLEGWLLGYRGDGYDQILERVDLFVYFDVDLAVAKARRFSREAKLREHGRGFSEDEMQRFWDEVLGPGIERWLGDAREEADLVIEADADNEVRSVRTTSEAVVAALVGAG